MNRSLRRLGQLLVVMGALLGAFLGVGLALLAENAETSNAVAAPQPERVAVLAASPSSSQPPAPEATNSGGNDSSANQRTQSANQRADKADKNNQERRAKPDKAKGKDKPSQGKDK